DGKHEDREGDGHHRPHVTTGTSRQGHPVISRTRAVYLLLLLLCPLGSLSAHAQAWPAKPIHIVVPSPPGGPPDLIIRMLAPKMSMGQPLVIENRAGAGGIVGTAYVAKQPAGGYTWLFTTASHVN